MGTYDFPRPEAARYPSMIVVSVTNACDFACRHCFHPQYAQSPDYQRHDMEMDIFRKIVDETAGYPGSILRLIAWGEPLCHPGLVDFIAYAKDKAPRSPLTLITNGYHMPPDRSLAMMKAGLDLIEISIDAITLETYQQLRCSHHSGAFATVEHNVHEMVRQREECRLNTRIAVSFVEHPTEKSRMEFTIFTKRWHDVVDEVIRRLAHTFKGAVSLPEPLRPRRPCYGLWARCHINPWGQINVCFNDWENHYVLGDLREPETTVGGAWQGSRLTQWRSGQCRGRFSGICKNCRDYNPDAWNHPYEEVVRRCRGHV